MKNTPAEPKPETHFWFIEPKDVFTNELLGKNLPEEHMHEDMLCEDGVKRNLWECTHLFLGIFATFNTPSRVVAKYAVFHREGLNGKVREWTFENKPRRGGRIVRGSDLLKKPIAV
jgi:hypothetical protein